MARREHREKTDAVAEESFGVESNGRGGKRTAGGIGGGSLTHQVGLFVVIMAVIGATFAWQANVAQVNVSLYKSEAAQKRSEAATQLSDFQARRTDQALAELARDLAPQERKAALQARADAFKQEKADLKTRAEKLESSAAAWDKQSEDQLLVQHRWIEAVIALQIAIVLAAIALMTRKRWLEYGMLLIGLVGLSFGAVATLFG
ncbi:MAG: DUF4337 family protein [Burkholderiales bacterium]